MKGTLTAWRKMTCVEEGDTGRTVYTDDRVYFGVFRAEDGTHWYVEWDDIDAGMVGSPRERAQDGTRVEPALAKAWVALDGTPKWWRTTGDAGT